MNVTKKAFNPPNLMDNTDLLLRQQRLLLRSAQLRANWAQQTQAIQAPVALFDRARSGVQWLYRHPVPSAAGLLALAIWKPRRVLVWGRRLLGGWLTFQRLKEWLG